MIPYYFSQDSHNFAHIQIHISPLTHLENSLILEASLHRYLTSGPSTQSVHILGFIDFQRSSQSVGRLNISFENSTFSFRDRLSYSSNLRLFQINPASYESINCSLIFETDLRFCKAFIFFYKSMNTRSAKFVNSMRIILSFSALYAFLGLLFCIQKGSFTHRPTASLSLAAAADFAMNPIVVVVPSIDFLNQICGVLFLNVYRWYVISEFGGSRGNLCFVFGYGLLELTVNCFPEVWKGGLKAAHVGFAVLMSRRIIGVIGSEKDDGKRRNLWGFGLFVLITIVATLVCEVGGIGEGEIGWMLIYCVPHVVAAMVVVFLQNSGIGGYESVPMEEPLMLEIEMDEEEEVMD
jgi:hypothetical protein